MSHATGQDATEERGTRIDRYAAERGEPVGTIRKRIQRGQLDAYKGADRRWYVLETVVRDAIHDATGQDTRQDATRHVAVNPNARAQLEAIRDEWLQPLVNTIAQQAERIGRLEAEGEAKDETLAELRRRAEVAEAALVRQREDEARAAELLRRRTEQERLNRERLQAAQDAPAAPEEPTAAHMDAPGVWARVRRWWGR